MKNLSKYLIVLLLSVALLPANLYAGNKDRAGQAGASELLINPFARSSGWGGANTATVQGLEGMYLNVAGIAFTNQTELVFCRTEWLQGSGVSINTFGLTQKVGEAGVIGICVMAMDVGEIEITTVDLPEGGSGYYKPSIMNFGISYAQAFSNSIYGGITLRIITEKIANITAQGVAIDAGIQYVTGDMENIHFGITLKNVGPTMSFGGDGLSIRGNLINSTNTLTIEQRSATYELPSLIKIGAAYDFFIGEKHTITLAGNFTSNSFTKDQFHAGLQYNMNDLLILRGGYVYESGIFDDAERTTALTGPTGGLSVQVPLDKDKGSFFSIDYSYRASNPWNGVHSIGARVSL
jgi:hypothetical protein